MSRVDDILSVIDSGLQSSREDLGSQNHWPGHCVRCLTETADGGFCEPCRAFMLGDSEDDPVTPRSPTTREVTVRIETDTGEFSAAVESLVRNHPNLAAASDWEAET